MGGGASGSKPSGYESFTDLKSATLFKYAVEAAGHRWPAGWVKGRGYVAAAPAPGTAGRPATLDEVWCVWLVKEHSKVALGRKKLSSLERDQSDYRRLIAPRFGSRDVTGIDRENIEEWVLDLSKRYEPKSVRNYHGLLAQLMGFVRREMRLRADNPCEGTMLPLDDYDRQIRFFDHAEWALLRRCLRSDVHLLVDVALHTGMRWGELTAIRIGDISWITTTDRHLVLTVHIARAWSRRAKGDPDPVLWDEGETTVYKLGSTKSGRDRWVQISGELARRVLAEIAGRRQSDYLFVTKAGKPWRYGQFHPRRWVPAVNLAKQHGLEKHGTIHMLRHTFVVWLLSAGESIHVISVRLGHASIQITMDRYGGLLNLHDASSANLMSKQMELSERAMLPVDLRKVDVDARSIPNSGRGRSAERVH